MPWHWQLRQSAVPRDVALTDSCAARRHCWKSVGLPSPFTINIRRQVVVKEKKGCHHLIKIKRVHILQRVKSFDTTRSVLHAEQKYCTTSAVSGLCGPTRAFELTCIGLLLSAVNIVSSLLTHHAGLDAPQGIDNVFLLPELWSNASTSESDMPIMYRTVSRRVWFTA